MYSCKCICNFANAYVYIRVFRTLPGSLLIKANSQSFQVTQTCTLGIPTVGFQQELYSQMYMCGHSQMYMCGRKRICILEKVYV